MSHVKSLRPTRRRQRGAGALIVVLVLFFVMALVAAYASRNMIFEQKTSANQYRSTQAFEAADAGIEWALAMLNTKRIDAACVPTNNAGLTSFRQRYLDIDNAGAITRRMYFDAGGTQRPLTVRCVRNAGGWSCNCPDSTAPTVVPPGGPDPAPAFELHFEDVTTRPGVVTLVSQGCTSYIDTCLSGGITAGSDAAAKVTALIALKGGLSTPPSAALTAGRAIAPTGGAMRIVNTDPDTAGVTVHAGGTIALPTPPQSLPGTPPEQSLVASDSVLGTRPSDVMFSAYFGMSPALYKDQPGTVLLSNCPTGCGAAALAAAVQLNPGRMLWLNGSVVLDANVDIGSPTAPVVMVVDGELQATAPSPRIFGLVYVNKANWATSGSGLIQGAAIASEAVSGTGSPTIVFDPDILRRLRTASGSFVRVPGGWKDF